MFITCQECNTIFRLDESLLKPTGSKVRCSLCRHTFIAKPTSSQPAAQPIQTTSTPAVSLAEDVTPADSSAASEGMELEGIDLAELDSILADDDFLPEEDEDKESSGDDIQTDVSEFESDLDDIDIDFDAALGNTESDVDISDADVQADDDDLDLHMNFEIDDDTIIVDEEMADLNLDSITLDDEQDTVPGTKTPSGEPSLEDDLAMALGDLDLSLEDSGGKDTPPAGEPEYAQDDLDLENLDFELEEEGISAASDTQESDLSFEDDLELSLDDEQPQEESELGFEDDLELSLEDEPDGVESASVEPELSLGDDLDLSLDDEPAEAELDQGEPDLSFDDDFDLSLEDEPADEAKETADSDIGLDDDFELSLDEDALSETAEAAGDQESELSLGEDAIDEDIDLDDLDSLLETTDETIAEDTDGPSDEGAFQMGDELDLDLDFEPETSESDAVETDEEIEELDFELDSDLEETPTAADAAAAEAAGDTTDDDEIDLSDIEEMLEGDTALVERPAPEPVAEEDDLGLGGTDADEIDLAEIETAIDEADTIVDMDRDEVLEDQELSLAEEVEVDGSAPAEVTADEADDEDLDFDLSLEGETEETQDSDELDLDLDLELEDKPKPAGDTVEIEDEELDLTDLSEMVEDQEVKSPSIDSGDIELDFQIEEETVQEEVTAASTTSGAARQEMAFTDLGPEQTLETLAVEEKPRKAKKQKPRRAKKKGGKLLGLLLFLLLLGAIAGGLYYAVVEMGIEIPYVSDVVNDVVNEYIKPMPKDTSGTVNLSTLNINSKFVENSQVGRLFVITGKVRNGYSQERTHVRLEGRLYVKGKKLVKKENSFAGIIISDQELAELPIGQIKQRLNTPPSPQASMGVMRPGQNMPFMVVFNDLPPADQLDEFAIEPISSAPGR